MDELTLWEIIEGLEREGDLTFTLLKWSGGWAAYFGRDTGQVKAFQTRKEALIYAITQLKGK
jgi:hypothetical protein